MTKEIPVGAKGLVALVDDEDYEDLIQFKWGFLSKKNKINGYACRRYKIGDKRITQLMHVRITGFKQTDHINGDGLDNRKSNLRQANASQNNANKPKYKGNFTSQYKGVSWSKRNKKWLARLGGHANNKYLGYFDSEIDAARAYDAAAIRYFGEFALLNFPKEIYE